VRFIGKAFYQRPARGASRFAEGRGPVACGASRRFCQCLAKTPAFCQCLAKCFPRAANGFANVWQIRTVFAKHWQNARRRGPDGI
jgi:hypothetical protein